MTSAEGAHSTIVSLLLYGFNATRDRGQKTALWSMRGGCPGPVVPYRTWTIIKFLEIGEIIIIYCEAFINFFNAFKNIFITNINIKFLKI